MSLGAGGRLLAAAAAAAHLRAVQGQIFKFESIEVPEPKSLQTLYSFYIYSHSDAPEKKGQPFVKFHGLTAIGAHESSQSVEVSLIPSSKFWDVVHIDHFCGDSGDAADKRGRLIIDESKGAATISQPARSLGSQDLQVPVRETNVYWLVVSNCGEEDAKKVKLSGNVIVKNSYGFLPGAEYHKLPFYGWFSMLYGALAVAWLVMSLRHWREVLAIQNCIGVVIGLGMLESCLWWIFYNDWNNSGTRGNPVFVMALLASVFKTVLSYMLVLVASLGWGVTRPYLDHRTAVKIQAATVLFIIFSSIQETILSFGLTQSVSPINVVLIMPNSAIHAGIYYWIFSALNNLIDTLKERKQLAKLDLFYKLWWVLTLTISLAAAMVLAQVFAITSQTILHKWKYQWFFSDGGPHILFLGVLVIIMYLWAPTADNERFAYTPADNKEGDGELEVAGMWADEKGDADDDDDDDESFWASTRTGGQAATTTMVTRTGPAPDAVGTTEQDD